MGWNRAALAWLLSTDHTWYLFPYRNSGVKGSTCGRDIVGYLFICLNLFFFFFFGLGIKGKGIPCFDLAVRQYEVAFRGSPLVLLSFFPTSIFLAQIITVGGRDGGPLFILFQFPESTFKSDENKKNMVSCYQYFVLTYTILEPTNHTFRLLSLNRTD